MSEFKAEVINKVAHKARLKDTHIYFLKVFDNEFGAKVLEHLETISKQGFPDVNNVNFTYAKAGQQQLVDYIKAIIRTAKKEV
jgi:hypothetical protein